MSLVCYPQVNSFKYNADEIIQIHYTSTRKYIEHSVITTQRSRTHCHFNAYNWQKCNESLVNASFVLTKNMIHKPIIIGTMW